MAENQKNPIASLDSALAKLDQALKVGHEIAEIIPNNSRKGEVIQIGGTSDSQLVMQSSLVMAQYQLLNNAFGFQPGNFKKWADAFEKCFPEIQKTPNAVDGEGGGSKPWNRPFKNRPRILIINIGKDQKTIPTYLYIEFYPDREQKEECYFIEGTAIDCVNRIWQIWNTRQVIKNADIAQVLGETPSESIARKPGIGITASFNLMSYPTTPFYKTANRQDFKRAKMSVPFIDKTKLTYQNIRNVLGGASGMEWGRSIARAWVCDDPKNYAGYRGMPQVVCRGQSYEGAKTSLKRIMQLSKAIIVRMSEGKSDNDEILNKKAKDDPPNKVYPGIMYILNNNIIDNEMTPGREIALGKLSTKRNRIEIYETVQPDDFDSIINELTVYSN